MIGLRVKNLITPLFDNLSFDLPATGLYGIIGRNGIGKSTLFSMISGEIKTDGTCITSGKVSYVPSLAIFDQHLSANDYLKLLAKDELVAFEDNLRVMGGADFFKQKIGKYSLGMKELFAFTFAVSISSDVLILDELLDGLDEKRRLQALNLLQQVSKEKLVIFTSHNLTEVFTYSDRVYLLEKASLLPMASLAEASLKMSI